MVQSLSQARTYLPIEDHGIIGDLHTVALVGQGELDIFEERKKVSCLILSGMPKYKAH